MLSKSYWPIPSQDKCKCMCVSTYVYKFTHTHTQLYILGIFVQAFKNLYLYVLQSVRCTHLYIHLYIYTYVYVCMYVHIFWAKWYMSDQKIAINTRNNFYFGFLFFNIKKRIKIQFLLFFYFLYQFLSFLLEHNMFVHAHAWGMFPDSVAYEYVCSGRKQKK